MNKKILFLACAGVLILCMFAVCAIFAVVFLKDNDSMSRSEAISYLQDKYPELKEYPSDNLPPKSIRTEKDKDDWYVAFVQEGSGRPIISAKCYRIKSDKSITTKEFIAFTNDSEFSVKNCTTIASNDNPDTSGRIKCGLENCHGLDVKCGANVAEVCDTSYQIGDKCLQYAKCGIENGQCQQIQNPQFTTCKTCVEKCTTQYSNDSIKLFECENEC